jgi:hypothetical protein
MRDGERSWIGRSLMGGAIGLVVAMAGVFLLFFTATSSRLNGWNLPRMIWLAAGIVLAAPFPGALLGPVLGFPANALAWAGSFVIFGSRDPRARIVKLVAATLWCCWFVAAIVFVCGMEAGKP